MHIVCHISESIWQMSSVNNCTTDVSEWVHITNVNEAYQTSNKVKYIQNMAKHDDQCTGRYYMETMLLSLMLQGWYDTNSAKDINLLSTTDGLQNICSAHLFCFEHC